MEELGELTRALSKVYRKNFSDTSKNNLLEECGDVLCMLKLLAEHGLVEWPEVEARSLVKRQKTVPLLGAAGA